MGNLLTGALQQQPLDQSHVKQEGFAGSQVGDSARLGLGAEPAGRDL
jgi:hypothetical protein